MMFHQEKNERRVLLWPRQYAAFNSSMNEAHNVNSSNKIKNTHYYFLKYASVYAIFNQPPKIYFFIDSLTHNNRFLLTIFLAWTRRDTGGTDPLLKRSSPVRMYVNLLSVKITFGKLSDIDCQKGRSKNINIKKSCKLRQTPLVQDCQSLSESDTFRICIEFHRRNFSILSLAPDHFFDLQTRHERTKKHIVKPPR